MERVAFDLAGKTLCLSTATTGVGGTATKARFNAPNGAGIDYAVHGLLYHKADADDVWTLSGTTLAASKMCLFLLQLNSAGTASISQGAIVSSVDVKNKGRVVPWPNVTSATCAVGAVLVETNSSTTFAPGTTSLSAAGVTATYFNFIVPPNKGLGSAYCTY